LRSSKKAASGPRLDELDAAHVFVQIVEAGSLSGAARALGRSVSAVSNALSGLERRLGQRLLHRSTRRQHLTEAGSLYVDHARGLVAAQRAAQDALSELGGGRARGTLRVSMPALVGERLLARHLPAFLARHPGLRVEVELSDGLAPILAGGFDLAIRVGPQPDATQRARRLGAIPVRLVASPALLASRPPLTHPRELVGWPCLPVGPGWGSVEWDLWPSGGGPPTRVTVEGRVRSASPGFAAALAVGGQGVLRTTEWVVRDALRAGELVEVLPGWSCLPPEHPGVPVWVVHASPAGVEVPLKSRVFVALVEQVLIDEVMPRPPAPAELSPRRSRRAPRAR
jgi:DNA-binding transcriptional LysR family regulator